MRFWTLLAFAALLVVSLSGCARARTKTVTVTLDEDGQIFVEGRAVQDLDTVLERTGASVVYLSADPEVRQAAIWDLVARLETAGVANVGVAYPPLAHKAP